MSKKQILSSSLKNSYYYTGHFSEHLQNIIKEIESVGIHIIGITPQAENREEEIKLYLKEHLEIDNYCILDDDYEMPELNDNLVKFPPQMQEGQEDIYMYRAIDILNKQRRIK